LVVLVQTADVAVQTRGYRTAEDRSGWNVHPGTARQSVELWDQIHYRVPQQVWDADTSPGRPSLVVHWFVLVWSQQSR